MKQTYMILTPLWVIAAYTVTDHVLHAAFLIGAAFVALLSNIVD